MKTKILPYNPKLVPLAIKLRNNLTYTEAILWKKLSKRQLLGFKFIRQKPIGNYIVDFYSRELELVIEIDGRSHDDKKFDYDLRREGDLKKKGLNVLRFTDQDVYKRIDDVLQTIVNYIESNQPNPGPLERGVKKISNS